MNENGSSTKATVGVLAEPHVINMQVANWNVEVATANSASACEELEARLSNEAPTVRMRVEPLLAQRRLSLRQIDAKVEADAPEGRGDGDRLVLQRGFTPVG